MQVLKFFRLDNQCAVVFVQKFWSCESTTKWKWFKNMKLAGAKTRNPAAGKAQQKIQSLQPKSFSSSIARRTVIVPPKAKNTWNKRNFPLSNLQYGSSETWSAQKVVRKSDRRQRQTPRQPRRKTATKAINLHSTISPTSHGFLEEEIQCST